MTTHVLFIQGAGEGAYSEDQHLVASLRQSLGSAYEVHYPAMPDEADAPYELWTQQIENELAALPEPVLLVGHSVGASVIIKWWSERAIQSPVGGIFLMATPFWGGEGWRYEGYEALALSQEADATLPHGVPIVLYHSRDDEVVPFEHLGLYARLLPRARVIELDSGGHQLNNDLSLVADDIKSLR